MQLQIDSVSDGQVVFAGGRPVSEEVLYGKKLREVLVLYPHLADRSSSQHDSISQASSPEHSRHDLASVTCSGWI